MKENDSEIYDEIFKRYRPSIKTLITDYLYNTFVINNRNKESIYDDSKFRFRESGPVDSDLEYIAIILDGTVKEAIRLNKDTAKILLSKYSILVPFDPNITGNIIGYKYIDNNFICEDANDKKN